MLVEKHWGVLSVNQATSELGIKICTARNVFPNFVKCVGDASLRPRATVALATSVRR